jgi:hypothetical protein
MILHIHCPCSCMNPQHNKPFSPWHKIRMLHLVEPHSPLHLNCMLMLHTLSTQDQQLPNPLRPDSITLRTKISATLSLDPYTVHGMTTCSILHLTKTLCLCVFQIAKNKLRKPPSASPWYQGQSLLLYIHLQTIPRELSCWLVRFLSWSYPECHNHTWRLFWQ